MSQSSVLPPRRNRTIYLALFTIPAVKEIRPNLRDGVALHPHLNVVPAVECAFFRWALVLLIIPAVNRQIHSTDVGTGLLEIILVAQED